MWSYYTTCSHIRYNIVFICSHDLSINIHGNQSAIKIWIPLQKEFEPIVSMLSQVCTVHTLTHLPSRVWETFDWIHFSFLVSFSLLLFSFSKNSVPYVRFLPVLLCLQKKYTEKNQRKNTHWIIFWFEFEICLLLENKFLINDFKKV